MGNFSVITTFTLSGLTSNMNHRFALFTVTLLCYCVILAINICLIVAIISDKSLHEPMYILICSLCVNVLFGTTCFYPKFLMDLLSPVPSISYTGCLIQALVLCSYAFSDLTILSVMAYDRYVAICQPFQYVSIMTKKRLMLLTSLSWIVPFGIMAANVFLSSRLTLCRSKINKIYCVNWTIVKLACFPSETAIIHIVASLTIVMYACDGVLILWSYVCLIKTCVISLENRRKFMQTCMPHLISVVIFVVAMLFDVITMRFDSGNTSQPLKKILALQFLVIPPLINPLVYGFKLTKIQGRILRCMKPNSK